MSMLVAINFGYMQTTGRFVDILGFIKEFTGKYIQVYDKNNYTQVYDKNNYCLQSFDTVGWAAGRASGL